MIDERQRNLNKKLAQVDLHNNIVRLTFDRHSVQFHLFADDKQSYVSGRVSEVSSSPWRERRHCALSDPSC